MIVDRLIAGLLILACVMLFVLLVGFAIGIGQGA